MANTTVQATVTIAPNDVTALAPLEAGEVATVDNADPYVAGLIAGNYLVARGSNPDQTWDPTA